MLHNFYSMTLQKKNALKTSSFLFPWRGLPKKTHPKTSENFFQVEGDEFVKRQPPKAVGSTPEKNEGGDLGNPGWTQKSTMGSGPNLGEFKWGKVVVTYSCFINGTTFVNLHPLVNPVEMFSRAQYMGCSYPQKSTQQNGMIFKMIHASRRVADLKRQRFDLDFLGTHFW